MTIIIGIIVFALVWETAKGRLLIGTAAKCVYSCIAFAICMAIPIPILNFIIAIWLVAKIWASEIG